MHPLVSLALKSIGAYLREHTVIMPPEEQLPEMTGKAGVFVSLKKHGKLRGCIGTFLPTAETVAEETIRNAIAAATQDPGSVR